MTAPDAERIARQDAGLACYKRRRAAERERQRQAEACCADCGSAGRFDPIEQATYHTQRAKEAERDVHLLKAETLEKTAVHLFTGALIILGLSLLVLAFSALALLDG
jgi:hypothetical protein